MDIETLEPPTVLLQQDDYPDKFYIVVEGAVERWEPVVTPLDICGELGVFASLPQPFSVRVTARTTLLSLGKKRFEEILQVNKGDGDTIAANVIQYLSQQHQGDLVLNRFLDRINNKIDRGEICVPLSINFAARRLNSRLLRQLIKKGDDLEDVYNDDQTILHILARERVVANEDCLITLIQHSSRLDKTDVHDRPALSYAIDGRRKSVLDAFHSRGAVLPVDEFRRIFTGAMVRNDLDLLRIIEKFVKDVNFVYTDGNTLLHVAVASGRLDFVRVLKGLGANSNISNASGETASDLARNKGQEMRELVIT